MSFGQGYVGTAEDHIRIKRLSKKRDEERKQFEERQQQTRDKVNAATLRQFGTSKTEVLENAFKTETVGLVTRAEFLQKRTTLQDRLEEEEKRKQQEAEAAAEALKERRKKEKQAKAAKLSKLSFMHDDEAEAEDGEAALAVGAASEEPVAKKARFGRLGKDPTVATEFLPDRDRERQEQELRDNLKKEWQEQQERIKNEPLEVTYSYWDGTGHRRKVTVRKGDSIGTFLKAARDQLAPEFRELRAVSVDNLIYIKEDLILPNHHTFYDLIINKARGKSGPLFNFTVHEDVRIVNDATVEKEDSHAGKVVERHWYDKNKHIFPASRWEVYDPDKSYDKYTIHGD